MKNEKLDKVYDFLVDFIDRNGYPPSVREVCKALDIKSTATVFSYLNKLETLGKIRKSPSINRALDVVDRKKAPEGTILVPVVGKIAAGTPITAAENIEEEIPLPGGYFKPGDLFILKVTGNSMIKAGIYDSDKLIFRKQNDANNGEIVAAMIDGEATVKRFFKENNRIRLQPENDELQPFYPEQIEILGVVTGLLRNYR